MLELICGSFRLNYCIIIVLKKPRYLQQGLTLDLIKHSEPAEVYDIAHHILDLKQLGLYLFTPSNKV